MCLLGFRLEFNNSYCVMFGIIKSIGSISLLYLGVSIVAVIIVWMSLLLLLEILLVVFILVLCCYVHYLQLVQRLCMIVYVMFGLFEIELFYYFVIVIIKFKTLIQCLLYDCVCYVWTVVSTLRSFFTLTCIELVVS